MRLKSLKLNGFKSFANPTTFTFKHDITAIVGPNGCGKSNVIDAIRWVLGESSAKQLRGGAMSDVIFAGTDGKAGKSLASVELTFEHTQDETTGIRHALNLYHELTLRRQITKDGKSDYFINGQRVRRRDVVDVFLGTGLGSRSYAVIEQGMIGRIIEADGARLREFIEESAGVSRYQARRAETQKQLDDTQENLSRLTDLQSELAKQHKILSKQAQSATEHQALTDELTTLHHQELLFKMFGVWQNLNTHQSQKNSLSDEMDKLNEKINQLKQELTLNSDTLDQAISTKDTLNEARHNASMAQTTAQHHHHQTVLALSQCDEKLSDLIHAQHQAQDNITKAQSELNDTKLALDEIAPKLHHAKDELTADDETLTQLHDRVQAQRGVVGKLSAHRHALDGRLNINQANQARLTTAHAKWQRSYDELTHERQTLGDVDKGELGVWQAKIDELDTAIKAVVLDDDKQALSALAGEISALKQTLTVHQKKHASLTGERDTLQKLVNDKSPAPTTDDGQYDSLPTLQESIVLTQTGQTYSEMLDNFLSFWLDARICDDVPSLLGGSGLPMAVLASTSDTLEVGTDELLPLSTLIATPQLHLYRHLYLYTGQGVPKVSDDKIILTKDGQIVGKFGVVQAGKFGSNSHFLSQKIKHLDRLTMLADELLALDETMAEIDEQIQLKEANFNTLKDKLDKQTAYLSALTEQKHHAQKQLIACEAKINSHALKAQHLHQKEQELDQRRQEHERETASCEQEYATLQSELADLSPKLNQAKHELTNLERALNDKRTAIKHAQNHVQSLTLREQSLRQKYSHDQKLLTLAQEAYAQASAKMSALHAQKDALSDKLPSTEQALSLANQSVQACQAKCDEHERVLADLYRQVGDYQERLTALNDTLTQTQMNHAQVGSHIELAQSRLDDLAEQAKRSQVDICLDEMLSGFANNPPTAPNKARLDEIRQKLDKLGAVNLMAKAQLDELNARLQPMDSQIDDIKASMDKLNEAIFAIDKTARTLFMETLTAVNNELNALFVKVFGGGQASLTLIDDDNLSKNDKWQAGLVLMAQPKGKKNSRLAVLSGGEKTLTALCLIFAIFKQHPAPFCVLDEVDAPLDDANVGRFTALIHELADSVQFIFISHNKLAMQSAHELKGITMPTAGISQLVTVSLDEAWGYVDGGGV